MVRGKIKRCVLPAPLLKESVKISKVKITQTAAASSGCCDFTFPDPNPALSRLKNVVSTRFGSEISFSLKNQKGEKRVFVANAIQASPRYSRTG
jgi:hypothetical protein